MHFEKRIIEFLHIIALWKNTFNDYQLMFTHNKTRQHLIMSVVNAVSEHIVLSPAALFY